MATTFCPDSWTSTSILSAVQIQHNISILVRITCFHLLRAAMEYVWDWRIVCAYSYVHIYSMSKWDSKFQIVTVVKGYLHSRVVGRSGVWSSLLSSRLTLIAQRTKTLEHERNVNSRPTDRPAALQKGLSSSTINKWIGTCPDACVCPQHAMMIAANKRKLIFNGRESGAKDTAAKYYVIRMWDWPVKCLRGPFPWKCAYSCHNNKNNSTERIQRMNGAPNNVQCVRCLSIQLT